VPTKHVPGRPHGLQKPDHDGPARPRPGRVAGICLTAMARRTAASPPIGATVGYWLLAIAYCLLPIARSMSLVVPDGHRGGRWPGRGLLRQWPPARM